MSPVKIGLDKCDRCGAKDAWYHMSRLMSNYDQSYPVCCKCWCELFDDGHWEIWNKLHNTNCFELADKFILDFLGKLR